MHPCSFTSQALFLPEVLFRIGCYLDADHALSCSQVCSTWYLNFVPLVWANLHIGQPKPHAIDRKKKQRGELEPRIRSIDLVSEGCNPADRLAIIRSKASWLRSLTFHENLSPQQFALGKECTQLQAISITGPFPFNDDYTRDYFDSCKALIKQNRSRLTSLRVDRMQLINVFEKLPQGVPRWSPILSCAGHSNLTELHLIYCNIPGRQLKPFWKICERLEKLTLDNVTFDYSRLPPQEQIQNNSKAARAARKKAARRPNKKTPPPPPPPKRFPNLRELTVKELPCGGPERFLKLIIADCPRLESLDWNTHMYSPVHVEHIISHIVDGTWPFLDRIRLDLCFFHFSQDQFVSILQHTRKPLKVLSFNHGSLPFLTERNFSIMKERHFPTLQEIDLSYIKGECWVQDVLASCPSLEIISGIRLSAVTVMEDKRPWACLGLKRLHMSLEISKGLPEDAPEAIREKRQQEGRALCAQLATLRTLRSISLTTAQPCSSVPDKEPLPLRLEMGLGLLAGQTQLESINLSKGQDMDRNDIFWIVENFTSLRMISGERLNSRKEEPKAFKDKYLWDYELAMILNRHGIATPSSIYKDGYLDDVRHLLGKGWPETDDLLYVEEEPAALEESVQATAPEEIIQTAVLEDAVQALETEDTIQIVDSEEAGRVVEPVEADQGVEPMEAVQVVEPLATTVVVPEETFQAVVSDVAVPTAVPEEVALMVEHDERNQTAGTEEVAQTIQLEEIV
ncbi:hypothetical protein BGZ70_000440 [Mortierella alpina]|uniref:F-box domain-containing protein n=1 Tax=Mortierella alpina TaxID=64518 RepID=A0A9P6IXW5_MORAP|nr:hypothetical protein BGZ70_000440 [Mortierella alpina]